MKAETTSDRSGAVDIWETKSSGPEGAERRVLLLAGALCPAAFYDDVAAQPAVRDADVQLIAATMPGHAGTAPLPDPSIEHYASSAGELASEHRCDMIVGHSLGANVALEMAACGVHEGPFLLLSPSFSRKDESIFPRALDRMSKVLGTLPYRLMFKLLGVAMRGVVPADEYDRLVTEMKNNNPHDVRVQNALYMKYLDRHKALVPRLVDSGAVATVVFGENDDIKLTDQEASEIEACERLELLVLPGASHLTMIDEPARIAELIATPQENSPSPT